MELDYRDTSRGPKIVVGVGIVLAVVTGIAAFMLINRAQQQAGQAGLQLTPVVTAIRQIPARKPVEPGDIEIRRVPVDQTNEQGTFSDPGLVVGRVLAVSVLPGQMVTSNLMASTSTGGTFTILEPGESVGPASEAWRAVSMTVPDDRAVGGLLQPNMTVDIFVTATVNVPQDILNGGRYYADKSTKITYQDMVILAKQGQFYVVRTTVPIAEEISHLQAAANAQFSFALRPAQDIRSVDASRLGATTNLLIERYGLPIPEVFPAGTGPIGTPAPAAAPAAAPSAPTPRASAAP
jgi:Flp pilus assembly protein CpaB